MTKACEMNYRHCYTEAVHYPFNDQASAVVVFICD